jgi:hypothetical protein
MIKEFRVDLSTGIIAEKNEKFYITYSANSPDGRYRAIASGKNAFLINNLTNVYKKFEILDVLDSDCLYIDQLVFSQTGKYLAISATNSEQMNESAVYIFRMIDEYQAELTAAELDSYKKNEESNALLYDRNIAVLKEHINSFSSIPEILTMIAHYAPIKIMLSQEKSLSESP